jgi:NADH dehydrogenase [ubiquinone] 1 alpha subcomplex assembly factor 7
MRIQRLTRAIHLRTRLFSDKRVTEFNVDRSGLINFTNPSLISPTDISSRIGKEPLTPLGTDLRSYIKLRGPITIHEFMTQAANHTSHGYYQNKSNQIGRQGDFITAPEVSQLFGEMIAIWLVSNWEAMGSPNRVNLVEMGPGNGVLMRDIFKTISKFPAFKNAIEIHFIELSQSLRRVQFTTLTGKSAEEGNYATHIMHENCQITWHPFFSEVPTDIPMLVVAQEFLDVFPVHQFVYGDRGWTEKLVDIDDTSESSFNFRMCLAPSPTPAIHAILHSSSVKSSPYAYLNSTVEKSQITVGEGVEISPIALSVVQEVSRVISHQGGAALFIDYGEDYTASDTLRGFRKHQVVNVLAEPGVVDVTADVVSSYLFFARYLHPVTK